LSAISVAFLISSTAILSVTLGVFGAYCAIRAVLAAFNPARLSSVLRSLIPNQSQVSGD